METTLVLLAESAIYCITIYLHNLHSADVWYDFLGPWFQKVSLKREY